MGARDSLRLPAPPPSSAWHRARGRLSAAARDALWRAGWLEAGRLSALADLPEAVVEEALAAALVVAQVAPAAEDGLAWVDLVRLSVPLAQAARARFAA